jgi:2-isopropylmalate synthase
MVGAEREFVLGKHTGSHSVRKRLEDAGYSPTDAEVHEVTRRVKEFGAEKRRVTMSELERFASEIGVERAEEVRA